MMNRAIAAISMLFLAAPAMAAPPTVPHERAMERMEEALDTVDATDAQRAATKAIVDETLPEMKAYRAEGKFIREDIRAAFEADKVDREALESARLDLVDLFDRATSTMFGMFADIADLYSPEQRAEWRKIREERRQQWRRRLGFDG
ncbi:MAG: Spy/CpxP family protein refolding chaperone [Myxococcota bacterium]